MSEADLERDPHTVPISIRRHVIERDNSCCRVCGQYVEHPALHHLIFRSQGGRNHPSNLITIGWTPGHDCHLPLAHGPEAGLWRDYMLRAIDQPGTTAAQQRRWDEMSRAPSMEETVALFWAKVDVRGTEECWEWQGSRMPSGHGRLQARAIKATPLRAHVFSYFLEHGRWPTPACLHHCDNAPCVNPRHLYEGNQTQNMRDRKERNPRFGARNPNAKHGALVEEIRTMYANGSSQADICRSLHLNSAVVSRIVRRINYP